MYDHCINVKICL